MAEKDNGSGIRPYGPGKFNTILDAYVYNVSLDGGTEEEVGESDASGWYGIMRHGSTIFRDHDPLLETLNDDERYKLTLSAGVIMREDSQGFVYVTYYDTMDELESAWQAIEKAYEEDNANDDETD